MAGAYKLVFVDEVLEYYFQVVLETDKMVKGLPSF